jgi:putative spermidine/putrescine transport system permease protein
VTPRRLDPVATEPKTLHAAIDAHSFTKHTLVQSAARRRSQRGRYTFLLLLAPLAVVLLVLGASLAYMAVLSLRPFHEGIITQAGTTVDNYRRFLMDSFYLKILWRTLLAGSAIVGTTIMIGYPVAYYISRVRRFRDLLIALTITPLLTSSVIRVYSWVYILGNAGFINTALQQLGLTQEPIRLMYNLQGVIVGLTHVFLPFMILSLLASLTNLDRTLEEAARGLGASRWRAFFTITLPLSVPGIIAGSLLVFTLTIASYITPAVLGSPSDKLLAQVIFDVFVSAGNWPFGAAIAFILLVVSLTVTVLYYRLMEKQLGARRI